LANEFIAAGMEGRFCDSSGLDVDDLLIEIESNQPDLIISDTHWSEGCKGEGLVLIKRLAGRFPFILTSSSPKEPQPLIDGARKAGGYFIDRGAGAPFIIVQAKQFLEDNCLDQEALNNWRARQDN
jgi:hypothetical protein